MKKGLIVLVLFILCFSATALALQITYDSIQEEVLPGQSVKYLIHLTNNADEKVTVTIKTVDIIWGMDKDSTRYDLNPREARAIEVTYAPFTEKITPKLYGITFQAVTDTTREIKTLPALVVDYQDTVDASFSSLPTIDPRRSTIVKVLLPNKHNILLEGIKVTLESQFFKEAQTVTLQGKEAQELEFPISLDPETIEGQYTLKTLIDLDNENLLTEEFLYTIGKYSNAKEVIQPEEGILVTGETITQTNEGNAIISETTQRRFGTLSYAFTDFTPAPTTITKTDQGYVASWTYNLQPGETIILQTTTNYRQPLLFALLILAVLALIYYFSKRHIEIIKKVLVLHTTQGGLAVMKILVTVKNPGKTAIRNASVLNRVPSTLKAPTEFGTLKPSHIRDSPDGLRIYWDIPLLKPGEERTLTYKIESKTHLSEKFTLPPAMAKFMSGTKKIMASSTSVALKPK